MIQAALAEANTSLAHRQAAHSIEAQSEVSALQSKVSRLEISLKSAKEEEKEARSELASVLAEERGKSGSVSLYSWDIGDLG